MGTSSHLSGNPTNGAWSQPLVAVLIVAAVALSLLAFLIIRWRNSIH